MLRLLNFRCSFCSNPLDETQVVVVVAIADGFTRRALSATPMVFLGKVSYSLYLTHAMVIGALVALLPRLGIVDPLAIAAVSLPASMLVSVVFWRIIEVPSMNLSRSLASSGPRDVVR
ncbi:acyltransferase family protein [Slackia isoflavoniconvertens]|nr:acyltransferase [Slackia isoflavoniconvertens]